MKFVTRLTFSNAVYKYPNGPVFITDLVTIVSVHEIDFEELAMDMARAAAVAIGILNEPVSAHVFRLPEVGEIVYTNHAVNGSTEHVVVKVDPGGSIVAYNRHEDKLELLDWWRFE